MTVVKICGIRDKPHAMATVEAGADFIGLVFAPSRRQITLSQAKDIVNAVKSISDTIQTVGVFVNMPSHGINMIADSCNLDWVQLSGDENREYCRHIARPIIKAVRIKRGQHPEQIRHLLAVESEMLSEQKFIYLLDSQVKGRYGGTGTTFDWNVARQAAKDFPLIIAGGLTQENVSRVIDVAAPWGVDVSSGVETRGIMDIAKIKAFIEAVRQADGIEK
jgi:phosphoribosylanthranilate isomerase